MEIDWDKIPEYNEAVDGLKIIYSKFYGVWAAKHDNTVQEFESEPELDEYLINELKLDENALEQGTIITLKYG